MSLALVQVGLNKVKGDEKETTWDVTAGGTYATGGEAITAATLLLGSVRFVDLPPATAGGFYQIQPVYNADGSVNLIFLETSAAAAGVGSGNQEKTNSEAYVASTTFRLRAIGTYA